MECLIEAQWVRKIPIRFNYVLLKESRTYEDAYGIMVAMAKSAKQLDTMAVQVKYS